MPFKSIYPSLQQNILINVSQSRSHLIYGSTPTIAVGNTVAYSANCDMLPCKHIAVRISRNYSCIDILASQRFGGYGYLYVVINVEVDGIGHNLTGLMTSRRYVGVEEKYCLLLDV